MSFRDQSALAIAVYNLNKTVSDKKILNGVDIEIPFGSITGFVGPNGAGKTTTMKALLALTSTDGGYGEINGIDFKYPEKYLRHVGALIETPAFYPQLSGRANIEICAKLANLSNQSISQLLSVVGLSGAEDKAFSEYSLGMKQKLGIAASLIKNPEILILDEPVNGLDPEAVVGIRKILEELRDRGSAILISSHLLAELELISDRFLFIDHGEITFSGTKSELRASGVQKIIVRPEYVADLQYLATKLIEEKFQVDLCETYIEVAMSKNNVAEVPADLNRKINSWGMWLNELSIKTQSLEERFFST